MKKILLVIIVIIGMSGCSLSVEDQVYNILFEGQINKSDLYYADFSSISTISDIPIYLRENIDYVRDEVSEWSTAKETLERGYGDCEDITIAYMNILYIRFNMKAELILVDTRVVEAGGGGRMNHCIVRLPNGTTIGSHSGAILNYTTGYSYSFNLFFNL